MPTGFHAQKFTSAVKNHLSKTRPSRVLVPPAAKQLLPPAPRPVIDLDADLAVAAKKRAAGLPPAPPSCLCVGFWGW